MVVLEHIATVLVLLVSFPRNFQPVSYEATNLPILEQKTYAGHVTDKLRWLFILHALIRLSGATIKCCSIYELLTLGTHGRRYMT